MSFLEQMRELDRARRELAKAHGLCTRCRCRPLQTPEAALCGECTLYVRKCVRKHRGTKPWRPGSRGRKPREVRG